MTETIPEPGIHRDLDFSTYAAWRAVNSGMFKWLAKSPKHGRAYFDGLIDDDDTASRKFGRAFHARMLEPDTFDFRFQVATDCTAVIGSGKRKGEACGNAASYTVDGEWRCGQHKGKDFDEPFDYVSKVELDRIDTMIDHLKQHRAIQILRHHGGCEESIVAEVEGVLCKIRCDKRIPPPKAIIVDVKTAEVGSCSFEDCQRSIENYGWWRQMSLYRLVAEKATGVPHRGIWVFIEKSQPYDVCVIQQSEEDYAFGLTCLQGVRALLNEWKAAVESGEYPGVCEKIYEGGTTPYFRERRYSWRFEQQPSFDDEDLFEGAA